MIRPTWHTETNSDWCSEPAATRVHQVISLHQRAPWCDVSLTSLISMRGRLLHQGSSHTPQTPVNSTSRPTAAVTLVIAGTTTNTVPGKRGGLSVLDATIQSCVHTHTHTHTADRSTPLHIYLLVELQIFIQSPHLEVRLPSTFKHDSTPKMTTTLRKYNPDVPTELTAKRNQGTPADIASAPTAICGTASIQQPMAAA